MEDLIFKPGHLVMNVLVNVLCVLVLALFAENSLFGFCCSGAGEVQTGTASNLPGNCSEEVKETATEVPSEKYAKVPAVALDAKMVQEEALSSPVKQLQREGHEANQQVEEVAQLVEAEHPPPGGQSPPQGNAFFDFDDLSAEPTLQKTELAENQARDGSGGNLAVC